MRTLFFPLILLVACANKPAEETAPRYAGCLTSFSADVREGPDAGTAVRGVLLLGGLQDATEGALLAGGTIGVGVSSKDREINLEIPFAGAEIQGSGTVGYTPRDCEGEMLGELVGPAEGDAGDWAGNAGEPIPWKAEDIPDQQEIPACLYELQGQTGGALVLAESAPTAGFFIPAGADPKAAPLGVGDRGAGTLELYDASRSQTLSLEGSTEGCPEEVAGSLDGNPVTLVQVYVPPAEAAKARAWSGTWGTTLTLSKDYEEVGTESSGSDGAEGDDAPADEYAFSVVTGS